VPAIIPQDLFDAAQDKKQRNSQEGRRNKKHNYLLGSGRLRCRLCGYVMNGNCNPAKHWRFYRCSRPKQLTGARCPGYVAATKVEDLVWNKIVHVLRHPELIVAELRQRQQRSQTEQSDLDRERGIYAKRLAQCDKDLKRWEAAYLAEAIDVADFKAKKAEIDTRHAGIA